MPVTLGDLQYVVRARLDTLDASLKEADRKLDAFRRRAERPINIRDGSAPGGDGATLSYGGSSRFSGTGSVSLIRQQYQQEAEMRRESRLVARREYAEERLTRAKERQASTAEREVSREASPSSEREGARTGLRLGRLSQVATAYFAIREVQNLSEGLAMQRNPLLNQSAQQTLQTQQQSIQKISSGLLGGVASAALSGLDALSILGGANADPSKSAGGFGILGRFSPYAFESATFGAERGIKQAQTGDSILSQRRSAELTADNLEAERGNILTRNPFNRRQNATATEAYNAQESLKAKDADLSNRLQTARTFGNREEVDNLSRELGELRHEAPRLRRDINKRADAEDKVTAEDQDLFYANQDSANAAERFRQRGYSGEAKRAEINAQFGAQFDAKGNLTSLNNLTAKDGQLFNSQKTAYNLALQGAGITEEQRGFLQAGAVKSAALSLSRDPLGSQLATIAAERTAYNIGKDQKSTEVIEQNRLFDLERDRASQKWTDQTKLIDIGLGSESRQIAAGMRRDRFGAEILGIVGAGKSRGTALAQSGRLDQGRSAITNIIAQLGLMKQNYLDAFRGQATDLRNISIDQVRDTQSPTEVLNDIKEGIQELNDTWKNLPTN